MPPGRVRQQSNRQRIWVEQRKRPPRKAKALAGEDAIHPEASRLMVLKAKLSLPKGMAQKVNPSPLADAVERFNQQKGSFPYRASSSSRFRSQRSRQPGVPAESPKRKMALRLQKPSRPRHHPQLRLLRREQHPPSDVAAVALPVSASRQPTPRKFHQLGKKPRSPRVPGAVTMGYLRPSPALGRAPGRAAVRPGASRQAINSILPQPNASRLPIPASASLPGYWTITASLGTTNPGRSPFVGRVSASTRCSRPISISRTSTFM